MTVDDAPETPGADDFTPLTPAAFHILLVLARDSLYGYGVKQEVEALTGGTVRLGPGTLYESIQRLERDGLIEEDPDAEPDHPQRRYYRPTALGRRVLEAELVRMDRVLDYARNTDPSPGTETA